MLRSLTREFKLISCNDFLCKRAMPFSTFGASGHGSFVLSGISLLPISAYEGLQDFISSNEHRRVLEFAVVFCIRFFCTARCPPWPSEASISSSTMGSFCRCSRQASLVDPCYL
ncbi:hypothetical protein ACFX2J_034815 [Malus domestica]